MDKSKYTYNTNNVRNPENLKSTWLNHAGRSVVSMTAAAYLGEDKGDPEYVKIFEQHYPNFSGKILEIGAGTGWFAKQILSSCPDVEYTCLLYTSPRPRDLSTSRMPSSA